MTSSSFSYIVTISPIDIPYSSVLTLRRAASISVSNDISWYFPTSSALPSCHNQSTVEVKEWGLTFAGNSCTFLVVPILPITRQLLDQLPSRITHRDRSL